MKLNIPITLAIACLSISLAFIILTFIFEYWLVIGSKFNYGMWRVCALVTATNTTSASYICSSWYQDGENIANYRINEFYRSFQGLQACMLGFIVITLVSIFFNLKICAKLLVIFIIDAVLIFLACACGLASLIIFGVRIHDKSIDNLEWCFWLSVAALALIFVSLLFLIVFIIRQGEKSDDSLDTSLFNKSEEKVAYQTNISNPNNTQKVIYSTIDDEKKNANENNQIAKQNNLNANTENNLYSSPNRKPTPINEKKVLNQPNQSSPRFQKNSQNEPQNQPSSSQLGRRTRKNIQTIEDEEGNKHDHYHYEHGMKKEKKKPDRHYWLRKSTGKSKSRYNHHHFIEKKPSQEQYRPGYSSEPDQIEYSLERSWLSSSNNNLNNSMPTILDAESEEGLTGTFNSRHFVKLPRLIFYDGSNHYTRASAKN